MNLKQQLGRTIDNKHETCRVAVRFLQCFFLFEPGFGIGKGHAEVKLLSKLITNKRKEMPTDCDEMCNRR